MTEEGYKLMSYNTSWVLDCSSNQFNDNAFLSESAAILTKMANAGYGGDVGKMLNDTDYRKNLDEFRLKLADQATEYIGTKLAANYDFLALIEQSIHVGSDHVANHDNYDEPGIKNKFDLSEENNKYGILRRINKLNANNTIVKDVTMAENTPGDTHTHEIVYDNIVNTAIRAAEGIAIIYKKSLIQEPLLWMDNYKTNNQTRTYSTDIGPLICGSEYVTFKGTPDFGRPIMMAGGIMGTGDKAIMNIFVSLHGVNVTNLLKPNPDTTDANIPLDENEKTAILKNFKKVFVAFIDSGLNKSISPTAKQKKDVNHYNLFIGGDFNDPEGKILDQLLIPFKINDKTITITLNNRNKLIASCCANFNSVIIPETEKPGALGPIVPFNNNNNTIIARMNIYSEKYKGFEDPAQFKFLGDYALFGTSDTTKTIECNLNVDDVPEQRYTYDTGNFIVSDHLPVISTVTVSPPANLGGKTRRKNRRTRRRRRTTRRNKRRNNKRSH